jgi:hypothetical protein
VCTLPRTERKFYVAPARVDMAYAVLRNTCLPDHVYPTGVVNSLYFDTFDLDEHDKSLSGDFGKDKVRIRWYGDDGSQTRTRTVFLELKSKQGFAGTKRRLRIEVPSECLTTPHLVHGIVPKALFYNTLAMFSYFPEQMVWPVIKITYQRYRFTEPLTGQRVSLDYHIRSTMVMPGVGYGEHELTLAGAVIEIKGTRNDVPVTLKRMGILDVDWSRFSKYSACIDAHMEQPGTVGRLSPSGRIV